MERCTGQHGQSSDGEQKQRVTTTTTKGTESVSILCLSLSTVVADRYRVAIINIDLNKACSLHAYNHDHRQPVMRLA